MESLKEAIYAVSEGQSIRDAAVEFSISKSTLWNYYKAHQKSGSETTMSVELGKNDTKLVFSKEQEEELANYLKTAARLHYGLTKNDCMPLAFPIC